MRLDEQLRRAVTRLLLPAVTLLGLPACVTTDVDRQKLSGDPGARAGIEVSIFASPKAQKTGTLVAGSVSWRLLSLAEDVPVTIRESAESRASVTDLAPGRYRVEVVRWVDGKGRVHEPSPPSSETFRVRNGEKVAVAFVLSDKRGVGWAVAAVVVTGIAIGVAAAAWDNSMSGISLSGR